jgi:hypothetical protein
MLHASLVTPEERLHLPRHWAPAGRLGQFGQLSGGRPKFSLELKKYCVSEFSRGVFGRTLLTLA